MSSWDSEIALLVGEQAIIALRIETSIDVAGRYNDSDPTVWVWLQRMPDNHGVTWALQNQSASRLASCEYAGNLQIGTKTVDCTMSCTICTCTLKF